MIIWNVLLVALAAAAAACFIYIQLWMHDPRRRQFNEEWYRQFENFRRARYDSREMVDSIQGFSEHFHRESRSAS